MRGVIESFDSATGLGTIRGKDGILYPFASTDLVRRSKPPHASARVVFLLKDGKIFRAVGTWHSGHGNGCSTYPRARFTFPSGSPGASTISL
jgi:hypothetical protein